MAIIDSMVWVSEKELSFPLTELRKKLTVMPRKRVTRAKEEDSETGELRWVSRVEEGGEPIKCFRVEVGGGGKKRIGLPIDWALKRGNTKVRDSGFSLDIKTVVGSEIKVRKRPNPNHPNAPHGQAKFFDDIELKATTSFAFLAEAPTGSGKTVAALNLISRIKRTALVIVPSTALANQWKKEAIRHLGMKPEEIGMVGGGQMWWRGCSIVIAVINSISLKEHNGDFYRYFGVVVWDEAHRLGATEFSKSMFLFPARWKIALTATPKRKDGMDEVFFNYFGPPSVVAEAPALEVTCWRINFPIVGNLDWLDRCRNDVRPMKWLAGLKVRNEMLADLIQDLYERGRNIIILSKFINHLEELHKLCAQRGIPLSDMGPYTGTWKGKKLGQGYLDKVRAEASIQFATYSKAKEGYDCPRLDAGIEATPVSDNIQGIGRVRRPLQGKKKPVWFTVCDTPPELFKRYTSARLRGFEKNNVIIKTLKGTRLNRR